MKAKQLPSGNYRVQVIDGYDENGKRIVRSFTAATDWEAMKMADDYKKGLYKKPCELTVHEAFEKYLESRDNILSPSTIKGYNTIKEARLQLIRNTKLCDLTISDVQRAVNNDAKRLSRKSIKSALALLKSAMMMQEVDINLKRITLPPAKTRKKEIPSPEQLMKVIIGSDIELPCLLAMWLSLRISEVRGLQFGDISPDGCYISIRRVKLYIDGQDIVRDSTKTVESARTNQLPTYLYSLIQAVPHEKDTDYIVTLSYEVIRKRFKKLMTENGFDITFHTLRHEFASTLNDLGVPSDYIQKLGGWSTDNVMKSVYTHTSSTKEKMYQEIIDGYFNGIIDNVTQTSHKRAITL
ncbi:MAG: site-specific integrase [Ruminococcus sp.]|nr:site-specific integrase [Ruminococcus sp.]